MDNIQITSECLKGISKFGETTYQNVCNGTISTVPWGTMDFVVFALLAIFISLLLVVVGGLIVFILKDMFDN